MDLILFFKTVKTEMGEENPIVHSYIRTAGWYQTSELDQDVLVYGYSGYYIVDLKAYSK